MLIALSLLSEMDTDSPNLTDTSHSESSEVSQWGHLNSARKY